MGLIGEGTTDRTVVAVKSHYSKGVSFRDSRPRFQINQYDQVTLMRLISLDYHASIAIAFFTARHLDHIMD